LRGVLSVDFDELAQVLDSEVSEGRRVLVVRTMDADQSVLGFHLDADLMKRNRPIEAALFDEA
jgi:hypothetical protein